MSSFDVFLSHSSIDKPWVARLKTDLQRYGVSAWLDRDEIRPGDVIVSALEAALEHSRAVALIVSPEAIASGWVEDEYARAVTLAKDKRRRLQLIPVLLRDAELPGFLANRNWVDFRDETAYAHSVWKLVWGITGRKPAQVLKLSAPDISSPRPNVLSPMIPLGKLNNVPELPPHFLPRPADLAAIKTALLTADQPVAITGAARKVGLQGMGGIGKSVLAAALARDDEVRRAFPDGLFWLTLGQEPALTTRQAQLAEAAGDAARIFSDVQQGRARLSELLAERACLLILDDVWQVAHAEAFNALGLRGQLLLTSRDAGIIRALGAVEHTLKVLTIEQARLLLAEWAGQMVTSLPAEADEVIRECGRLPLALTMIGAMVRGKPADRWGSVLAKLRQADLARIRQQFPYYPYPDLLRALHVSVEALEPEVQARYLDLAVFPEDTPIPEAALQTFWAVEGLDEYEAQDVIDTLVDRSLARRDEGGRLRLHDLQYDYVRKQAGDLPALHRRLIAAYRHKCPQGWTNGPNDGYFFDHLAYHLAEAGERETLYALISKEWMDVQFQRTYSHLAFAGDVERAIAVAGAEEPPNLVQVIRGCLIYATLGELATNVPPEILGVLAQVGQVERALGYAALMHDAEKRSTAYRLIGQALMDQNKRVEVSTILEQALVAAGAIEAKWEKALALSEVAQVLAQAGDKIKAIEVADRALVMIEIIQNEEVKIPILKGIAQVLAKIGNKARAIEIANQALAVVATIEDEWKEASALSKVIPALTEMGSLDQALAATEIIKAWWRAPALREMAQILVEVGDKTRAIEVINQAWVVSESIEDQKWKASILSGIAEVLAELGDKIRASEVANQALAAAEAIKVEWWQASALSKVAFALFEVGDRIKATEVANRALLAAEVIENEREKWSTLTKVAQVLVEVGDRIKATEVVNQALAVTEIVKDRKMKASALKEVAHALAGIGNMAKAMQIINRILIMVTSIRGKWKRTATLSEVAQVLAEVGDKARTIEVANQALVIATMIEDKSRKASALSKIAQVLAQVEMEAQAIEVANQALIAAVGIEPEWSKASILSEVAQALAQAGVVDQALAVAIMIQDKWGKASALSKVAQVLVQDGMEAQVTEVTNRALAVAIEIEDEEERAFTLSEVAQVLAQAGTEAQATEVANRVLAMTAGIEDEEWKASALGRVAQILVKTGQSTSIHQVLYTAYLTAKLAGRESVFETLQYSASALVALDQGQTLWQVYEAIMEVEGWWGRV